LRQFGTKPRVSPSLDDRELRRAEVKLLTDEHLSSQVAASLRAEDQDAVSVHEADLAGQPDASVFAWAWAERRVVVTQDLDVNALRQITALATEGLVLLRLNHPSTSTVLAVLRRFLRQYGKVDMRGRVASVGSTTRFQPPL